ncbi:ATP-dependent dethiobiotin synthetase BioD [Aquihabitans sp. McL0605]|uniref:ATP-dependent dethiobiotin synthetase BioD n=1 Tax=Aquihabitans sp. McL0605 TaxID=3415671 RepID=UPI003CF58510
MTRPVRLVLVAGTATDIGKTWVGGQVLARLRAAGTTVAARKPAQSADLGDPGPSDAQVLAGASGEPVETVCLPHRSYTVAMAPPMAAAALGLPVPTIDDLLDELRWPAHDQGGPVGIGWLETVGGPRSPIGSDGDAVTVAGRLEPDLVVLVADAGLGTVNAVLLSAEAFGALPVVVFLNRFDPADDLHARNLAWLREQSPLHVVTDLDVLTEVVGGQGISGSP